jgi:chromosome segregation ATPase
MMTTTPPLADEIAYLRELHSDVEKNNTECDRFTLLGACMRLLPQLLTAAEKAEHGMHRCEGVIAQLTIANEEFRLRADNFRIERNEAIHQLSECSESVGRLRGELALMTEKAERYELALRSAKENLKEASESLSLSKDFLLSVVIDDIDQALSPEQEGVKV